MRKIIFIILACCVGKVQAQTANAGVDQTIYLPQGNTATLDGSASSGTSYLWREVSTDYNSGGTITSPTSKTTTVTGLPQGVFYFELAATSGGTTRRDSMKVIVNSFSPPKNATLALRLPFSDPAFAYMINRRDDTTSYFTYQPGYEQYWQYVMPDGTTDLWLERDRQNGMMLDSMRGKLYNIIQDGWGHDISGTTGTYYSRSTLTYGSSYAFDTLRTYILDWQAYFPQVVTGNFATTPTWGRVALNGMHGSDDGSGSTTIDFGKDSVEFVSTTMTADPITGLTGRTLGLSSDWVNKAHTVRIYVREGSGYPGQKGFIKVLLDGSQVYFCDTGLIGKTLMTDYYKLTGLYDYRTLITDPTNHTRNKIFSLVTENSDVYTMNNTPTVDAGADQNIATTTATLTGNATDEGVSGQGTISAYQWTKISGGTATITSPTSASTTITGLSNGTYQFQLKATDNTGHIGYDTMQVVVAAGIAAPTLTTNGNQTITVDSTALVVYPTWAAGHSGTYLWTQISGPNTASIPSYLSASTWIKNLIPGTYVFDILITQDDSQTAHARVNIVVTVPAPTLSISGNQNITVGNTSVYATASWAPGHSGTYLWTKVSGPSTTTFGTNTAFSTTVTGLQTGTYVLQCKITQDDGQINTAQVTVTVLIPLVIDAGNSFTVPINTIFINNP